MLELTESFPQSAWAMSPDGVPDRDLSARHANNPSTIVRDEGPRFEPGVRRRLNLASVIECERKDTFGAHGDFADHRTVERGDLDGSDAEMLGLDSQRGPIGRRVVERSLQLELDSRPVEIGNLERD
jgi:hypothetical protein